MMREIKFRVWDKLTKSWTNNLMLCSDGGLKAKRVGANYTEADKRERFELCFYTGFKDKNGKPAMKKSHKVDFRIHHKDGSFELYEAKGAMTTDYRDRVRWLEAFWLPEHLDHTYTVVRQSNIRYGRKNKS